MQDQSSLPLEDRRINSLQLAIEINEPVDEIERHLLALSKLGYFRLIKTVDGVSTFAPTQFGLLRVQALLGRKR